MQFPVVHKIQLQGLLAEIERDLLRRDNTGTGPDNLDCMAKSSRRAAAIRAALRALGQREMEVA